MTRKGTNHPVKGRPSKYDPSFCARAIEYLAEGYSTQALAGHFDVNLDTVYEWIKAHADFSEAIKDGEAKRAALIERRLRELSQTGQGNAAAAIFLAKNWTNMRDKTETEIYGKDGSPLFEKVELETK